MGFNIPDIEPDVLVAGDSWQWTRDLPDFPNNANWSLAYYLTGIFALTISAASGATPTQYSVNVLPATTAGKSAGTIKWDAKVTNSVTGEIHTVDSGVFNVLPNRQTLAAGQTTAEVMVANIGATLTARYQTDIAAYTINLRQAHREGVEFLERAFARWSHALWKERHPGQAFPGAKVVFESARWDLPGAWASVEARWPFLVGTL